jgi:hypothetical protein
VLAVLALRRRGLDPGSAAGIRLGLLLCLLGMLEAGLMIANRGVSSSGGHTVGAADGGPGLPLTDWSLDHGDLRIAHFAGLHALQLLPLAAWALARFTPFAGATRVRLLGVLAVGYGLGVVLLAWQAERGQALLRPDALTLAAVAALLLGTTTAAAVVLVRGRAAARVRIGTAAWPAPAGSVVGRAVAARAAVDRAAVGRAVASGAVAASSAAAVTGAGRGLALAPRRLAGLLRRSR